MEKNSESKKKKFQIFIWNDKIQKAFNFLIVINVALLFFTMQLQGMYINFLEYKVSNMNTFQTADSKVALIEGTREYDLYKVIKVDDFLEMNELEDLGIGTMAKYFNSNGYSNIKYEVGYFEATIEECNENNKCYDSTYVYNQKKGVYISKYSKLIE